MSTYPFYSCDSASWQIQARFGNISEWTGTQMKSVHYTDKENVIKYQLFDIIDIIDNRQKKQSQYEERYQKNIKSFIDMGDFLNNLWKKRGVVWSD